MPAVQVTLNGAALRSLAISVAEKDLRVRANRVLNAARRLVPRDTSRLGNSLTITYLTGPSGEPVAQIGSNLSYALYVHEGTGLYGPRGALIRPRTATVLRWPRTNNSGAGRRRYKAGATEAFVYSMWSRGVKGRPFLLDALDAAR